MRECGQPGSLSASVQVAKTEDMWLVGSLDWQIDRQIDDRWIIEIDDR